MAPRLLTHRSSPGLALSLKRASLPFLIVTHTTSAPFLPKDAEASWSQGLAHLTLYVLMEVDVSLGCHDSFCIPQGIHECGQEGQPAQITSEVREMGHACIPEAGFQGVSLESGGGKSTKTLTASGV